LPQVQVFHTPREQRDLLNPLPFVSAARSLRQEFIKHFGGLRGMDPASFDEIWKVTKNGYNKAYDPHFLRFRMDFLTHSSATRFNPTGIQPGDLVGFLRREHDRGAAHPTLKDAAASVSSACAQASDGLAQLGSQASVIAFLKFVKQNEAPDRRERMLVYPDIARLIQMAWEFGPNGNISLEQLKRKLVILLLVDTAARPSDIWRLNCTLIGKYRQIEFVGENDVRIRYYWPKEVDPFSSRTNATNTWFSQWVLIRGTVPASTDTVSCLREFMQRSSDPEQFTPVYIAQIATAVQPLIFAKTKAGLRTKCSVDHISNIAKKAIAAAGIPTMKPRHIRGASTSKIVLLSPEATAVAMGLGRWTTAKTFLQHYNAPIDLMTMTPRPDSIALHGQQLLRWGWTPTPPLLVTAEEYDEPFTFWVGKSIPRLGRISKFDNGKYTIKQKQVTHGELMGLLSTARGGNRLTI
jgi:integrase